MRMEMALVEIFSEDAEGMEEALKRINAIAFPPVAEVGADILWKGEEHCCFWSIC